MKPDHEAVGRAQLSYAACAAPMKAASTIDRVIFLVMVGGATMGAEKINKER